MEENSSFPICNHIQCVDQNNIGFVQDILTIGIVDDGICDDMDITISYGEY